jgi:BolA family transcriptional regulator, general stress-responsive regulator
MAEQNEGPVKMAIERKLRAALAPIQLVIVDESHHHAGHGGRHPDGESHFRVELVSAAFAGKSRVERHRMVNGVLAEELATRVHALAVTAKAPGEAP